MSLSSTWNDPLLRSGGRACSIGEGGVVTIPNGYWPFFRELLKAGAHQAGIILSLADPPVPADEADLADLQHRQELTGRFRKILNHTRAVEVEGAHHDELIAFRDRVLSGFGRYADPDAYMTLHISEWHGGLHVAARGDPQFGFTMFGGVPLLLAALERAIADCAQAKGDKRENNQDGVQRKENTDGALD